MQLDQNPFFRKTITPWYDSNFACWMLIAFLILSGLFGSAGILVGLGRPDFMPHVWFPGFLTGLSLLTALKVFLRLRNRARND